MTEWFVELLGSEGDLSQLATVSCPPSWEVRLDDGRYFLLSSDFDALTESSEVHSTAINQTFEQVLGAAKLFSSFRPAGQIEVGGRVFYYDSAGNRQGNHFLTSGKVVMSATTNMTANLSGGRPAVVTQKALNEVISTLRSQPEVGRALRHFGSVSEDNWAGELYKVMEIVTADVGRADMLATNGSAPSPTKAMKRGWELIQEYNWATADEVDGFRAVHYEELAGTAARHAIETQPRPTKPISSQYAATKFVRRILEAWLRQKDSGG